MATVFDIIEVDDEKDVLRVKQATEKGYIEVILEVYSTVLIQAVN